MARQAPPKKSSGNKTVIILLIGGIVILAIAGVVLYQRQGSDPEPEPVEPKVEEKIDVPAPLVVSQKQSPIETEIDGGPEVATEQPDTDGKKPRKPKGGGSVKLGTIDGKAVNKYINQHFGQVRTCYERRLKINPMLEGKVDLNIGISTKGKATSISVNKDTVGDPQMIGCIKGVIRNWALPKPEGGRVVIAKQFKFKKKV